MSSSPDITELSTEECWEFLASQSFGRLAFSIGGDVDIIPINYVTDQQRLVFRTAEGTKLFGVTMNDRVAFEVDQVSGDQAQSVIVRGHARQLEGRAAEAAEELPLRPWIPTLKYIFVEIAGDEVTGRRFHLGPEPDRY